MKSFKKIFLMLTSFAMVVGTLLIGGGIKKTEMVEAATQTDSITMKGFGSDPSKTSYVSNLETGTSKNGLKVSASNYIPDSGQIRGNKTTNNQNFYLYNTDPTLGSIRSVVITGGGSGSFSAGMYISVGTESQSSVTSTTGCTKGTVSSDSKSISWSFDETTEYTFFKLFSPTAKFTSGTVNGVVINIEYDYATELTVTFNANSGTCNTNSLTVSNGSSVTLPGATRDGYTFGGWKTANNEIVGNEGELYTPTENITLYAIWNDNAVIEAKETLDTINSYMSYGFKYDVSTTKHGIYLLEEADNVGLVDKSIVIVAHDSTSKKYYAVKNDASASDNHFGAIQVELDENKLLKPESYINNLETISWKLEKGSTDKTYKIGNGTKYISGVSKETNITLSDKASNCTIVGKSINNVTYNFISVESRFIFCKNSDDPQFKNYSSVNVGASGYCNEMYIYVVGENVDVNALDSNIKKCTVSVGAYSNVDIRLKCGIDDRPFDTITLPSGAKYGIAVSTASKTVYYEIVSNSTVINEVENPGDAEPNKYVIIKLGNDLLNNFEKVTTEFTTQAYLYVDNMYYLSSNTKTYSVASLTKVAVDSSVEGVSGLYNILSDMGCYNAAQ